jgi:acyl transferase domain-containing protein
MEALPAGGAMAAVRAEPAEVRALLPGSVSVAAVNGPRSLVISGPAEDVDRALEQLAGRGRKSTRLKVSHAFHSALMDPVLEEFHATAAALRYAAPAIPVISHVTGRPADAEPLCSADYWTAHLRDTVHFADGVTQALERGVTAFLELGPDEFFNAPAITLIEWAERVVNCLPKDRLEIQIEVEGEFDRVFVISSTTATYDKLIGQLEAKLRDES